jgi:DNA-binding transcriptional ArsR family regulator
MSVQQIQLIQDTASLRRGLVADPEAKHVHRMRQAVRLYLNLLLAANPETGKRLLSPALIAREMGLREETIRSWLGHLRGGGYVTLERQGDLVLVTVNKWRQARGRKATRSEKPEPATRRSRTGLTPVKLAQALGCAPGEPFLAEVLTQEDPERIRAALEKVTRVPEDRIRKSRLALFRYLLTKHSP